MHRDHDHGHHHHRHDNHGHDHERGHSSGGEDGRSGTRTGAAAGLGHNDQHAYRGAVQWQRPHEDKADHGHHDGAQGEPDLDQVEAAFVEGFMAASDPTSFLRLASVPFEATAADGAKLSLLRVETDLVADVGSVAPHLGGKSFRYDPLPASLVSRRRRLRFVYFDGTDLRTLSFAEVREL